VNYEVRRGIQWILMSQGERFGSNFCRCSWGSNLWITENCRGRERPPSLGYGEASEQQRGNIFAGR
jgi:hypothetical protein